MTNSTLSSSLNTHKHSPFGMRLKSAREALGMDRKDVAAHLRLSEKIILMIESGDYKTDIPMTFIRGYIRNYSKLVQIPDKELQEVMELLKPKPEENAEESQASTNGYTSVSGPASSSEFYLPVNFDNVFMKLFTLLLAITLTGLVGIWWHSHKSPSGDLSTQNQIAPMEKTENKPARLTHVSPVTPLPPPVADKAFKNSFNQLMQLDHATQFLTSLVLFLILLTFSMRIYARPAMAGVRSIRTDRRLKNSVFNLHDLNLDYLINPKIFLPLIALTMIVMIILGGLRWAHHFSQAHPVPVKQPVHAEEKPSANPLLEDTLLITDIETWAPSSSLYSLLHSGYQFYTLQEMSMALDHYIHDADATLFALTDKSMPIAQFIGKKPRRHRRSYIQVNNEGDHSSGNNASPYYYQQ